MKYRIYSCFSQQIDINIDNFINTSHDNYRALNLLLPVVVTRETGIATSKKENGLTTSLPFSPTRLIFTYTSTPDPPLPRSLLTAQTYQSHPACFLRAFADIKAEGWRIFSTLPRRLTKTLNMKTFAFVSICLLPVFSQSFTAYIYVHVPVEIT